MKLILLACLIGVASASLTKYNSDGFYPDNEWNPLPDDYEGKTAAQKLDTLWGEVTKTDYEKAGKTLPQWSGQGFSALLKNLKAFFNLKPVFTTFADVIEIGRTKAIHTYGTVAKFTFTPVDGTSYTGIFSEATTGVVRMSLGQDPKKGAMLPGAAWKFLIDGQPSVNVVSNWDLDGQKGNNNFFLNPFRSWLPKPRSIALKILSYWFSRTESNPGELPVKELAQKNTDGTDVANPMSPNILVFVPVDAIKNAISSSSTNDFRDDLMKNIKAGPAFDVYAASTFAESSNPTEKIGSISLDTAPIASFFGDSRLFYRHQSKIQR